MALLSGKWRLRSGGKLAGVMKENGRVRGAALVEVGGVDESGDEALVVQRTASHRTRS